MIYRINRTGGPPPVYASTLHDVRRWAGRNPGEMASFDKLQGTESPDLMNALTAKAETLAAALNEIACWPEGVEVHRGCEEPDAALKARSALRVAGLVPVGGSPTTPEKE